MKLKHLYMLGVVALMTASCNEDRFLDLKPQGSLNEDIMTSTEGADLLVVTGGCRYQFSKTRL